MSQQDFNILFASNLSKYLSLNNMTQAELAARMHVSTATVSNWCKGIKFPRMDKVDKICSILNIKRSALMEDTAESDIELPYYIDDKAKEIAQFMYQNPEYKVLFEASKNIKKEDIEIIKKIMEKFIDE